MENSYLCVYHRLLIVNQESDNLNNKNYYTVASSKVWNFCIHNIKAHVHSMDPQNMSEEFPE